MDDSKQQVVTPPRLSSSTSSEVQQKNNAVSPSGDDSHGDIECKDTCEITNSSHIPTQTDADGSSTHVCSQGIEKTDTCDAVGRNPSANLEECPNKIDAIKCDSSQCDPNEAGKESLQDNPSPSVDSSPTTPSTSGQDSGVVLISPDDSSWETNAAGGANSKLLEAENAMNQSKEDKGLKDVSHVSSTDSCIEADLAPKSDLSLHEDQKLESSANEGSPVAAAAASSDQVSVYYIKWVLFGASKVPIITQNENGPCPLLAIVNVLLLKGKVSLAPMLEMITSEQLMDYLADCIFENMPQDLPAVTKANYEQNMQDAMGVMGKLQTGLDVNVKFTGVGDFEYTSELIIFDLLEISLYHGWLVDPQDSSTVEAINQCSYNLLVEKIISLKQSDKESDITKGLIAEQFLDRTASQLTYHGLCELSSRVKDSELCVFFRNNHFNTLYKHNNELFLLVTDQGFLTENNVVWETLSNVDGDGHFVDASFRTYTRPLPPTTQPIPNPAVPVGSPEQIDQDFQVALSLLEDEGPSQPPNWPTDQNAAMLADHEYALRLQEQENQRAAQEQQRAAPAGGQAAGHAAQGHAQAQGQGRHPVPSSASQPDSSRRRAPDKPEKKKEDKLCTIL